MKQDAQGTVTLTVERYEELRQYERVADERVIVSGYDEYGQGRFMLFKEQEDADKFTTGIKLHIQEWINQLAAPPETKKVVSGGWFDRFVEVVSGRKRKP